MALEDFADVNTVRNVLLQGRQRRAQEDQQQRKNTLDDLLLQTRQAQFDESARTTGIASQKSAREDFARVMARVSGLEPGKQNIELLFIKENSPEQAQNVDRALSFKNRVGQQRFDQFANTAKEKIARSEGGVGTAQTFFESQLSGANLDESQTEGARRIALGLDPRAVGSASQTITATGTAPAVALTEETLATGRETGKLTAQLELKPQVESAVQRAVATADAIAENNITNRSNTVALEIYDTAMGGLVSALTGTVTGPFAGLSPALSANQQIADGAVAALAPVLKQMFRSAGEGIFTDKDQELLLAMVPTRTDRPAAITAKLANIDAIVRAKLGQRSAAGQLETAPIQQTAPQPNQIGRFTVEVVE